MILDKRDYYRPFEYQKAYDYYRLIQLGHWTKDRINMAEDVANWRKDITDTEKNVIGGILKGFTQIEIMVGDYWRRIAEWLPKPEISMMASAFSYNEAIHVDCYALINEELGLDDFKAFLSDGPTKEKLDYFMDNIENPTTEEIAVRLAVFSAFAEGVSLFSSFAVLLSFQRENLLKGVSQIVNYSIKDESTHSEAGCWLFNTLCEEVKDLRSNCKDRIIECARDIVSLEEQFIENLFKENDIRTVSKNDLINFIRHRTNMKLKEIGYEPIYNVDSEATNRMSWFDILSGGKEFTDFFARIPNDYTSEKELDINSMWD